MELTNGLNKRVVEIYRGGGSWFGNSQEWAYKLTL